MGEVWKARDTRLGREVAVKVLPAGVASDPSRLKHFEKEARSASALSHPNIVTNSDIGASDSVSYIAMEMVAGKTLRELLFGGSFPIKKSACLALPRLGLRNPGWRFRPVRGSVSSPRLRGYGIE